jgi:hypothetical protein
VEEAGWGRSDVTTLALPPFRDMSHLWFRWFSTTQMYLLILPTDNQLVFLMEHSLLSVWHVTSAQMLLFVVLCPSMVHQDCQLSPISLGSHLSLDKET